jgi:hypothetical protein
MDVSGKRPGTAPVHHRGLFAHERVGDQETVQPEQMIAAAGGDSIRCAPYATFGTSELSQYAVKALEDRLACLLARPGYGPINA